MNKKGVEMSMQVIVVAVIILLVAGILIYLAVSSLGNVKEGTDSCKGTCQYDCTGSSVSIGGIGCPDGQVCCINNNVFGD